MLKDVDLTKMKGRIQFVEHFANAPGKWQIVSASPDIKLKIVENFGDFKIQFTEYAYGIC